MLLEQLTHIIRDSIVARRTASIGLRTVEESLILQQKDESLEMRLTLLAEDDPSAQKRWGIVHRPNFTERSELGLAGLLINFVERDVIRYLNGDERIKRFETQRFYAHDGLVAYTYPQGYFDLSNVPPLSLIKVLSDRLATLPVSVRDQLNPNIVESASQAFVDLPNVVGNINFPHRHHRFVELSPYSALDVAFSGDWEYEKDMTNIPIDRYRIDMVMRDPGEKMAQTLSAKYRAERIKEAREALEPNNLRRWVGYQDPQANLKEFVLSRLWSKDQDEVTAILNRLLEQGYTSQTLEDGSTLLNLGDDYSIQFSERKGKDSEGNKETGYEPVVILSEGYQATRSEQRKALVNTSVQEFISRRINSATKDKPFSFNLTEWELRRDISHMADSLHIEKNEMTLLTETEFISLEPPEFQPTANDDRIVFNGEQIVIHDTKNGYVWRGTLKYDEFGIPLAYELVVWNAKGKS